MFGKFLTVALGSALMNVLPSIVEKTPELLEKIKEGFSKANRSGDIPELEKIKGMIKDFEELKDFVKNEIPKEVERILKVARSIVYLLIVLILTNALIVGLLIKRLP